MHTRAPRPVDRYAPDMKAVMEQHPELRKKTVGKLVEVFINNRDTVENLLVLQLVECGILQF